MILGLGIVSLALVKISRPRLVITEMRDPRSATWFSRLVTLADGIYILDSQLLMMPRSRTLG